MYLLDIVLQKIHQVLLQAGLRCDWGLHDGHGNLATLHVVRYFTRGVNRVRTLQPGACHLSVNVNPIQIQFSQPCKRDVSGVSGKPSLLPSLIFLIFAHVCAIWHSPLFLHTAPILGCEALPCLRTGARSATRTMLLAGGGIT